MISVIIPIYNGADFIEETYNDISKSKEKNLEIILVDDGSVDNSGEIIKKIAEKDKRVHYYKKENGGIASARNYGLERATGEYVCFADQDDRIKEDMFLVLREDIEQCGADIVKANNNQIINGVEETVCKERKCTVISREKQRELYNSYLQTLILRGVSPKPEYQISVSIWTCLFRTAFLKENNIRFYSFCDYEDDWIFCIQAFRAASVFCLETKTIYSWNVHTKSESHNRIVKDRYLENFYHNHKRMQKFLLENAEGIGLTETETEVFRRELQKQVLLWALSNETQISFDEGQVGNIFAASSYGENCCGVK